MMMAKTLSWKAKLLTKLIHVLVFPATAGEVTKLCGGKGHHPVSNVVDILKWENL
jgi:hypothetical protein